MCVNQPPTNKTHTEKCNWQQRTLFSSPSLESFPSTWTVEKSSCCLTCHGKDEKPYEKKQGRNGCLFAWCLPLCLHLGSSAGFLSHTISMICPLKARRWECRVLPARRDTGCSEPHSQDPSLNNSFMCDPVCVCVCFARFISFNLHSDYFQGPFVCVHLCMCVLVSSVKALGRVWDGWRCVFCSYICYVSCQVLERVCLTWYDTSTVAFKSKMQWHILSKLSFRKGAASGEEQQKILKFK